MDSICDIFTLKVKLFVDEELYNSVKIINKTFPNVKKSTDVTKKTYIFDDELTPAFEALTYGGDTLSDKLSCNTDSSEVLFGLNQDLIALIPNFN